MVIEDTIHCIFEETDFINQTHDIHILIFDSASTDETQKRVESLQKKYTHLHLQTESEKTGLGSAYHQAMQYALHVLGADVIVEFDADLSHQPKYLVPMLHELRHQDVVVGSRYILGGKLPQHWGLHRRFLSKWGNVFIKHMLNFPFYDLTSGFRMIRREALQKVLPQKFISNQFAYKIELYWKLYQHGYRIAEYPIEFVDRTLGQSKLPKGSIRDSLKVVFSLVNQSK